MQGTDDRTASTQSEWYGITAKPRVGQWRAMHDCDKRKLDQTSRRKPRTDPAEFVVARFTR